MGDFTVEITDANFEAEVLQSEIPVLIDFWAVWCGPCRMIEPIVDEVAQESDGKVKVGKVNVDENPGIAANYGIRSIPTLLFFANGTVQEQVVGAVSKQQITGILDKLN